MYFLYVSLCKEKLTSPWSNWTIVIEAHFHSLADHVGKKQRTESDILIFNHVIKKKTNIDRII